MTNPTTPTPTPATAAERIKEVTPRKIGDRVVCLGTVTAPGFSDGTTGVQFDTNWVGYNMVVPGTAVRHASDFVPREQYDREVYELRSALHGIREICINATADLDLPQDRKIDFTAEADLVVMATIDAIKYEGEQEAIHAINQWQERTRKITAEHERLLEEAKKPTHCPRCTMPEVTSGSIPCTEPYHQVHFGLDASPVNQSLTPADDEFLRELDERIDDMWDKRMKCGLKINLAFDDYCPLVKDATEARTALRDFVLANRGQGGGDIDREEALRQWVDGVGFDVSYGQYRGKTSKHEYSLEVWRKGTKRPRPSYVADHSGDADMVPAVEPVGFEDDETLKNLLHDFEMAAFDQGSADSVIMTQSRVDDTRKAIIDYLDANSPSPVAKPVAEPVGYANLYNDNSGTIFSNKLLAQTNADHDRKKDHYTRVVVPLFDHPSPVAGAAVGSKGVVEELREAIDNYSIAWNNFVIANDATDIDRKCEMRQDLVKAKRQLFDMVPRIIELPEPSEYVKQQCGHINCDNRIVLNLPVQKAAEYAAALLAEVKP